MKLHVLYLSVILLGNTLCGAEFIAGMKTEDFNARYDKIERGKAEKQWSPASVSAPERKKFCNRQTKSQRDSFTFMIKNQSSWARTESTGSAVRKNIRNGLPN